jgi:4-amino-4-deoxy-L-arabinose transferase-like glycosyltransferase
MFALGTVLRLALLLVLDTPGAAEGRTAWDWGGEAPALGEALAEGRGFADPWRRPVGPWAEGTGPSAWLTPLYPALLALAMRLGDGIGPATAWWVFGAQALLSAWTAVLLVRLGEELGLARAARLAGWLFALHPVAIWNAVGLVWDTTAVAFGTTAFFLVLLRSGRSYSGLARSGAALGALLLLNPAPVAFAPAVWAWIALDPRRAGEGRVRGALGRSAWFTLVALAVCLPWMARNQRVLGTWQLRPNLGVELRIGNHDGATGRPEPLRYHPSHVAEERALYVELGEAAYCRENLERARAWIAAHPGEFAALTLRRAALFWLGQPPTADPRRSGGLDPARDPRSWIKFLVYGLSGAVALVALVALARLDLALDRRILLAGALLAFGGPYYLTHVSERYRFPIDPLIVLLDAWLLLRVLPAQRGGGPLLDNSGPAVD